MTITAILKLDAIESVDPNNVIFAFFNDTCRGLAYPVYISSLKRYIYFLNIDSVSSSETLKFRVYNSQTKEELDLINSLDFENDKEVGDIETPYVFTNVQLSDQADLLSYNIDGAINQYSIGNDIFITMPIDTKICNLIATFGLSENAAAYVGTTQQQSGISTNNFLEPVTYKIVAQNGNTKYYRIIVKCQSKKDMIINELTHYATSIKNLTEISTSETILAVEIFNISKNNIDIHKTHNLDNKNLTEEINFLVVKTNQNIYQHKLGG